MDNQYFPIIAGIFSVIQTFRTKGIKNKLIALPCTFLAMLIGFYFWHIIMWPAIGSAITYFTLKKTQKFKNSEDRQNKYLLLCSSLLGAQFFWKTAGAILTGNQEAIIDAVFLGLLLFWLVLKPNKISSLAVIMSGILGLAMTFPLIFDANITDMLFSLVLWLALMVSTVASGFLYFFMLKKQKQQALSCQNSADR